MTNYKATPEQWNQVRRCADVVGSSDCSAILELRAARRPKPPSLKLQALNDLNTAYNEDAIDDTTYCNIRRALETLPDD